MEFSSEAKRVWLLAHPPFGGVEEGDEDVSDGMKDLLEEGAKPDELEDEGDKGEDDKGDEKDDKEEKGEDKSPDLSAIEERLSGLESTLAERDAEITFLRGEVAKRGTDTTKKAEPGDEDISAEALAKILTGTDPVAAAKAVIELANKIADKKLKGVRDETTNLLTTNEAVRVAKEEDRQAVLGDFSDYLDDKDFTQVMATIFTDTAKQAGGRYLKNSLYSAAATAKVIIDKRRAVKAKTKNGVKEVKAGAPDNPLNGDTHNYASIVTIDGLPANMATVAEKTAMKGAFRKMHERDPKVTEKQWVQNFIEQQREGN